MNSEIFAPRTRQQLLEALARGARPIAGGTDYFAKGFPPVPQPLVCLWGMEDLCRTDETDQSIMLGAALTMHQVDSHPLVRRYARALMQAAGSVGSLQIRNGATLGGNLANGSPAADTPPALLALDAKVGILSPGGERTAPIETLIDKTAPLAPDEVIWNFTLPKTFENSAFCKLGSRKEVTISRINLAVAWNREKARVAVGTLGNAGRLCPQAGEAWIRNDFNAFVEALQTLADRAIAGRSTLPYKRRALIALAQDLWKQKEAQND